MSQVTISVPHITIGDKITVVFVVAGILTMISLFLYQKHYTKKQIKKFGTEAKKLGDAWIALLLNALAAFFVGLGYLLTLAPSYTSYLSTIPFIGKHVLTIVGIATTIYLVRGKTWFKKFTKAASAEAGIKDPLTDTPMVSLIQPEIADPNRIV